MTLRLKYACLGDRVALEPDPRAAVSRALSQTPAGERLYVLPTYTAMLAVRDLLRQTGYVRGFWED